jgi:hypothetical protein
VGGRQVVAAALGPDASRRLLVIDYILPIRCETCIPDVHDALIRYLATLAADARVIVADGSPVTVAKVHADRFGSVVVHRRVEEDLRSLNGKVAGVRTGLRHATAERVIIADDDVRYTPDALRAVAGALDRCDLVIPQNVFDDPMPWHARWDTARSLLNRAVGTDYPGTLAIRRSAFLAIGGYDGNVVFENLELIRTVQAAGGRVSARPDLYVSRLPPSTERFVEQRIRQAYDDFARPTRMAISLAVVPASVVAIRHRRLGGLLTSVLATVAVAELGRRRAGGTAHVHRSTPLFAPVWILERGVCSWLAIGSRLVLGGCSYRGTIIQRAATPRRVLRRRLQGRLHASRRTGVWSVNGRTDTAERPLAAG